MKLFPILLVLTLSQGCAFNDIHLSIALPEDAAPTGPLSELSHKEFSVVSILDIRPDNARIGYRRNGFDQEVADILPDEPVEDIIQRSIEETLVKNGHRISEKGIRVRGEISVFWFEWDINFRNIEFIGQIACELVFSTEHGELYRNNYVGSYNHRARGGFSDKPYRAAMNGALASLAEDIAFDSHLATALNQ